MKSQIYPFIYKEKNIIFPFNKSVLEFSDKRNILAINESIDNFSSQIMFFHHINNDVPSNGIIGQIISHKVLKNGTLKVTIEFNKYIKTLIPITPDHLKSTWEEIVTEYFNLDNLPYNLVLAKDLVIEKCSFLPKVITDNILGNKYDLVKITEILSFYAPLSLQTKEKLFLLTNYNQKFELLINELKNIEQSDVNYHEYPLICTQEVPFLGNEITIDIKQPQNINSLILAKEKFNNFVVVVAQKSSEDDEVTNENIYQYGALGKIISIKNHKNNLRIKLQTLERAKISALIINKELLMCKVQLLKSIESNPEESLILLKKIAFYLEEKNLISSLSFINRDSKNYFENQKNIKTFSASEFADQIAFSILIKRNRQQEIFEELEVSKRLQMILTELDKEKAIIKKLEDDIARKVRNNIDQNQKEFFLREKLRVIKEELGETSNREDEDSTIREKLKSDLYPENIKAKIKEELKRLEMMSQSSGEYSVIKTYIDWLMKLPWTVSTKDNNDLSLSEDILNQEHFGLEKIKQRIVEYLAVKQMTDSLRSPILCFVGPPGVGKTSIAKSVANALGRKFVKIALNGIKDEAEIRGHRRTYLASMPGRIIQAIKKSEVNNPVFLLDEIDKMGYDYKGDPSTSLLEILDPEQNNAFSDHYIEEPFDLSKVLFIATANYIDNVPPALKDRLEIINLSSYTEIEKISICKSHLFSKQLLAHGLKEDKVIISDEAILHIIRYYTREAGVRQLERLIATVCRKLVLKKIKSKSDHGEKITIDSVKEMLGKEKFDYTKNEKTDQVGVVTGLAYTEYGGDILPIEANYFEGKGNVVITGNLGDIMKESATISLDYIKANINKFNISSDFFQNNDIHIHVPEGAVPKDGPSAGITMTTAIVSAITNTPVNCNVAMTGEITLHGKVLAIGGLKEKSISAHRSGIKIILIPKDNEKDIEDLPEIVRKELDIITVDNIENVLKIALNTSNKYAIT